MHFYTYDDWIAHAYSTVDARTIIKGQTKVIDLSDEISVHSGQYATLNISSGYNPINSVKSTYAGRPSLTFSSSNIDCDLGCLYKLKDSTSVPEGNKYGKKGCIQVLGNSIGSNDQFLDSFPYIRLFQPGVDKYNDADVVNEETISIDLTQFSMFDKILVFQSIYSGAISFQEAETNLKFRFGSYLVTTSQEEQKDYQYIINTNLYSATSLMIVGALLTFETSRQGNNTKYLLTIENISEFVYGHVDMDEKYDWNLLWKGFVPSKNAKVMPSSIMHYSKN